MTWKQYLPVFTWLRISPEIWVEAQSDPQPPASVRHMPLRQQCWVSPVPRHLHVPWTAAILSSGYNCLCGSLTRQRFFFFFNYPNLPLYKWETENIVLYLGSGGENREWLVNKSPWGVMNMVWNSTEVLFAQRCEYMKCHWVIHVKMVNFVLCAFHLN